MVFIYLPILYLKNWLLKKGENYNPFSICLYFAEQLLLSKIQYILKQILPYLLF